jgi:hypothetical protein
MEASVFLQSLGADHEQGIGNRAERVSILGLRVWSSQLRSLDRRGDQLQVSRAYPQEEKDGRENVLVGADSG